MAETHEFPVTYAIIWLFNAKLDIQGGRLLIYLVGLLLAIRKPFYDRL